MGGYNTCHVMLAEKNAEYSVLIDDECNWLSGFNTKMNIYFLLTRNAVLTLYFVLRVMQNDRVNIK